MKKAIALLLIVLGFGLSINAQVTKTLAKSISLDETKTAYLILPGPVNVSTWDNDYIRVTTTINVQNMNENILKCLVMAGRYSIEVKVDKYGKMLAIKMPHVENFVFVKGVDLIESYSFEVTYPKGYHIAVKEDLNPKAINKNSRLGQTF